MERLWARLAQVDGFMEGASIFSEDDGDRAYFVNGTQVANATDNQISLRLKRAVISQHRPRLKADPRVDLRRSGSDWITIEVATDDDIEFVAELAELAAASHRPPDGSALRPPPEGAELARRRKFH